MKYPLGNLNNQVAFFSIMRSCLSQLTNKYCDCDLQFRMKFSVGEEGEFSLMWKLSTNKNCDSKLLVQKLRN